MNTRTHTDYHAPFQSGNFYHILNRGINGEKIFANDRNRYFFLRRFWQYFAPYVEIWAWVLLGNHFHTLVKIKEVDKSFIEEVKEDQTTHAKQFLKDRDVNAFLEGQAKRLFTSYAKAFNKDQGRYGSLFMKRFRRILVDHPAYASYLVHYIHYNPVKHGFVEKPEEWGFSSYRKDGILRPSDFLHSPFAHCHQNVGNLPHLSMEEQPIQFLQASSRDPNFQEIDTYLLE